MCKLKAFINTSVALVSMYLVPGNNLLHAIHWFCLAQFLSVLHL